MRVWDVSPGYLSDASLLGEHVEVHAVFSILAGGKAGYAHHPEVLRWKGRLAALHRRRAWLCAEMAVRGFVHRSPLPAPARPPAWPTAFLLPPLDQLRLLRRKYGGRSRGRLCLPRTPEALWRQHELSVLARGRGLRAALRRRVREGLSMDELALRLVLVLRRPAAADGLRAARLRLESSSDCAAREATAWGDPELEAFSGSRRR